MQGTQQKATLPMSGWRDALVQPVAWIMHFYAIRVPQFLWPNHHVYTVFSLHRLKSYRFKTIAQMGGTRQYVRWDWLFKQHLLKPPIFRREALPLSSGA